MKKDGKVALYYLRGGIRMELRKADRITGGVDIRDHGQESPHWFLDVSHLTSET